MTEAEYVFNQDIREKKTIKNSASKTNRTGKGPIRFPSDYLSKKEKEGLNGECSTWKFSDFPNREDFNRMPDDIKISYLNWIQNTYNVGLSPISKYVFGQTNSALHGWMHNHPEISMYINRPAAGTVAKKKDIEKLISAVKKARAPKAEVEKPVEETSPDNTSEEPKDFTEEEKEFINRYLATISDTKTNPDPKEPVKTTVTTLPRMTDMTFSMDGFDMDFLQTIAKRFGEQKIHVCVSVYVEKSMEDYNGQ